MFLSRNKLYATLLMACMAGYGWLYYVITSIHTKSNSIEICLLKRTTAIPCPSCGSTRAIISLIKGNIAQSLYINPFGIGIALIMLFIPPWIIADIIAKKNTLFNFYSTAETYLKKPILAIPLIVLVLINWIWNIKKGL